MRRPGVRATGPVWQWVGGARRRIRGTPAVGDRFLEVRVLGWAQLEDTPDLLAFYSNLVVQILKVGFFFCSRSALR